MKKLITLLVCVFTSVSIWAESPTSGTIACYANVNFSLDENCEALVLIDHILYSVDCPDPVLVLTIEDEAGNPVSNPVTGAYIGQTLRVFVTNTTDGNSCWSDIIVEDKTLPVIESITVTDAECGSGVNVPIVEVSDNCDAFPNIVVSFDLDCHPCTPQEITYTIYAEDASGNATAPVVYYEFIADFCPQVVYPADVTLDCGSDTDPGLTGNVVVVDAETCSAGYAITYSDEAVVCGLIRHWILTETCSGRSENYDQTITFVDTNAPIMVFTNDTEISLNDWNDGFALEYEAIDDCTVDVLIILLNEEYLNISCSPVTFDYTSTFKIYDNCGNFAIVTHTVHVSTNKHPKVKVEGNKNCNAPFVVTATVKDMVLPLTYVWSSSNPSWTVVGGPGNTATVTSGNGTTFIEAVVTDAIGCVLSDDKKYKCNNSAKGNNESTTRSEPIVTSSFYPNPAYDLAQINIEVEEESTLVYEVFDITGRLIFRESQKLHDGDNRIYLDLYKWKPGVYFVQFLYGNEIWTKRLIKQ